MHSETKGGTLLSSRQIYFVRLLQSLKISWGGKFTNSTMCIYGWCRDQSWKVSHAVAILHNFYPPKRIKVNWATWQLMAAVNLNVFSGGFFFLSCNGGIGIFLKIPTSLIATEFVTLVVTTSEKNVWMKEVQWKESVCILKAIKEKFYPKRKYSFWLPGLLSFMSFYLDFQFLLLLLL